jgi:hypothetical protein
MKRTVLLVTAGALAAHAVAAGSASPATAGINMSLCTNNQPGTFATPSPPLTIVEGQSTAYGYRSSSYIGPGMRIHHGDVLRIRATGWMNIGGWPSNPTYSPDGSPTEKMTTLWGHNPNVPKYSLYGYFVSNQEAFPIGHDSGCVPYPGPGETWLWLTQNDDNVNDNNGVWSISIQHYGMPGG